MDRGLSIRANFSLLLICISIACLAVAWGHWEYTLNTCSNQNCGCILFGTSSSGKVNSFDMPFFGGNIAFCHFVVFGQIPVLIITIFAQVYYGRRYCKSKRGFSLDPPSGKTKVLISVISFLCWALLISIALTTTVGFYKSCNEYRKIVTPMLSLSGNAAEMVQDRLACPAIYDFMDYLQPDRVNPDSPKQYPRMDTINTAIALLVGKAALFMNSMQWLFIFCRNTFKCCQPALEEPEGAASKRLTKFKP